MKHIALVPIQYAPRFDEGYGFTELKWLEEIDTPYRNFFLNAKQHMTILDNSPRVGGGWPLGARALEGIFQRYAKATQLLHRPVIVAPDVVNNRLLTRQQSRIFANLLKEMFPECPPRWMAVPQGSTAEEYLSSYADLIELEPDMIGISYIVPYDVPGPTFQEEDGSSHKREAFNRLRLVQMLRAEEVWTEKIPHHLLGIKDPLELQYYAHLDYCDNIVTNDSACAYKATRNNIELSLEAGWPGTKDTKVLTQDESLDVDQLPLLEHNVSVVRTLAAGQGLDWKRPNRRITG